MSSFLIADDSEAKAMMLEAMVKRSGITTQSLKAKTTDEAKQMIDHQQIDWAFIDYEMPTEEGPAVIAYLKKKQPKARIALVSSADAEQYQTTAFAAGAEYYICTSYASDEVEARIKEVLERWRMGDQML